MIVQISGTAAEFWLYNLSLDAIRKRSLARNVSSGARSCATAQKKPSNFTQEGSSLLLGGRRPRGRENICAIKPADSGCVGRPVAKCHAARLLFSAVSLRSQDQRARRYRR